MKKLLLSMSLATFALTACSSGVVDLKPVSATQNIKHICLKGSIKAAPDNFIDALTRSLKNKNINNNLRQRYNFFLRKPITLSNNFGLKEVL